MSENKDYQPERQRRHRSKIPRLRGTGPELVDQALALLGPTREALVRTQGWEVLPFRCFVGHLSPSLTNEDEAEIRAVLLSVSSWKRKLRFQSPDPVWHPSRPLPADTTVLAVLTLPFPLLQNSAFSREWPPDELVALDRAGIPPLVLQEARSVLQPENTQGEHLILRRAWFAHEGIR